MDGPQNLVCFDFWNTLVHEARAGALVDARIPTIREALLALGHNLSEEALREAHAVAQQAFEDAWGRGEQYRTDHAAAQLIDYFGIDTTAASMVQAAFERGGSLADVRVVPGAADAVSAARDLGAGTAIVCDVGLTPSVVLRQWLDDHGLADYFDFMSFSDETGRYKPCPEPFDVVRSALALPSRCSGFHVGDRRLTDVAGARAAGLVPIRFRGVFDDEGDGPEAEYVVDTMTDVALLLERLLG